MDGLIEEGYTIHLANPSAIRQYEGLKHSDDVTDAFHLANLLRLGILRTGYIYPKEERPVRDLLAETAAISTTTHAPDTKLSESCFPEPG